MFLTRTHHTELIESIAQKLTTCSIPISISNNRKFIDFTCIQNWRALINWTINPFHEVSAFTVFKNLFPCSEASLHDLVTHLRNKSMPHQLYKFWIQAQHLWHTCESTRVISMFEYLMLHPEWSAFHPKNKQEFLLYQQFYDLIKNNQFCYGNHLEETWPNVDGFLEIAWIEPILEPEPINSLRFLTIHGSKGLESPIVILLLPPSFHKFQEGCIIKNKKKESSPQDYEEERVLYVALTRAKEHLYGISFKKK
jgi:ATP-dependent exoDNAse (exonuclease V) beta subunit